MTVRDARPADWPAIWPVLHEIVVAGDTLPYPLDLAEDDARALWFQPAPGRTVVAVSAEDGDDGDEAEDGGGGTVLGTAKMHANREGNGGHVASATYLVDPARHGRGVGRALVEDSLRWARAEGFRLMQFNAVVETNEGAVHLYRSLGFEVTGRLPGGFRHPRKGYVGLLGMHRAL